MIKLVVEENDSNQTLINFLKKIFKHEPLSKIYYLFYKKKIRINNVQIKDFKYLIKENDIIIIYDNKIKPIKIQQELAVQEPIKIAYQDDNILVAIKDHNVLVHSVNEYSLDNMVKYYFQEHEPLLLKQQTFVISHQYRLDKLTKGLVIYPKNRLMQQTLKVSQDNNDIIKKYYAVVSGKISETLDADGYIHHDEEQKKMIFSLEQNFSFAKNCRTLIKPIYYGNGYSLLECQLLSGKKHQIRATLAYYHAPIVGDFKYGSKIDLPNKILLFAYFLAFKNFSQPFAYLNDQEIILANTKQKLIKIINDQDFN